MSWNRFKTFSSRQKTGLILITLGLFSLLLAFSFKGYQAFQQNILSFSQAPEPISVVEEGDLPEKVLISKIKLDLLVSPVKVVDNQWIISEKGVSYLLGSGIPGREGNVVIYGHNKSHLFGPIRWLEIGEEIKLISQRGDEYIYSIVETKIVSPETVEVLAPTKDAILTLYTCTGFLDRERFVVIAKLQQD